VCACVRACVCVCVCVGVNIYTCVYISGVNPCVYVWVYIHTQFNPDLCGFSYTGQAELAWPTG